MGGHRELANAAAVNHPGAALSARMACATWRIRGLLKSIPPTLLLPTCEGAGSCSRVWSAIKHWSTHDKVSMNLSRMPFKSETISGNLTSDRPQSSASVLWADRKSDV